MFVLQVDVDWILLAYVISVLRCAVFGAGCAQDLSAKVHEDPGNTVAVFGFFGHVRAARLFHAYFGAVPDSAAYHDDCGACIQGAQGFHRGKRHNFLAVSACIRVVVIRTWCDA